MPALAVGMNYNYAKSVLDEAKGRLYTPWESEALLIALTAVLEYAHQTDQRLTATIDVNELWSGDNGER